MNPAAEEPLPFEGFENLSRQQQDDQLLDRGFRLLQKHSESKRVAAPHGTGTVLQYTPVIRAKFGAKRNWYVLERNFGTVAARDRRLGLLLQLPKHLERLF